MVQLIPVDHDPFEGFDQFTSGQQSNFDTKLTPHEETQFQSWKERYAPKDSGVDYDLRGAFKAGHTGAGEEGFPDAFTKPNHPNFGSASTYFPDVSRFWEGNRLLNPAQNLIPSDRDQPDVSGALEWQRGVDTARGFDRPTPEVTGRDRARELMMAMGSAGQTAGNVGGAIAHGIGDFLRTPGATMRPNPYPVGSEEAQHYENVEADRARAWGPEAALNMVGGGTQFGVKGLGAAGGKIIQPEGIRAYHGSPHDFERFDISKIGTGEGAQAYGHGLYFAENPKTAQSYRDMPPYNSGDPSVLAAIWMDKFNGNKAEAAKSLSNSPSSVAQEARRLIVGGAELPPLPRGKMYEVNINAKPDQFLDWDKPLAQQSHLLPQLNEAGVTPKNIDTSTLAKHGEWGRAQAQYLDDLGKQPGQVLYRDAGSGSSRSQDSAIHASAALREVGIPGIKYLDQGSRVKGGGTAVDDTIMRVLDATGGNHQKAIAELENRISSAKGIPEQYRAGTSNLPDALEALKGGNWKDPRTSNYVLFDDKLIDILRKYGLAGLAALPPAVAAHVQSRLIPVDHDPFAPRLVPVDHDPFQ